MGILSLYYRFDETVNRKREYQTCSIQLTDMYYVVNSYWNVYLIAHFFAYCSISMSEKFLNASFQVGEVIMSAVSHARPILSYSKQICILAKADVRRVWLRENS